MIDVFKAMCYRIYKSRVVYYALFFAVAFAVAISFTALNQDEVSDNAIIYGIYDNITIMGMTMILVFISIYQCNDFKNKTLYYEVMGGHSRIEVFTGRLTSLTLFSVIICNIQIWLSIVMLNLWMNVEFFKDGVIISTLKIIGAELLVLAYIIYFITCSFIGKNFIVTLSLGWAGIVISQLTSLLNRFDIIKSGIKVSYIFGSRVIAFLFAESFSVSQFLSSSVISLMIIFICILIGKNNFKNSDLN